MLLQDPAGELCRYIEQWHSLELMQLFATPPAVNMQRGRNLLYPNYPPLPPPRVNQLIIPTGATRWGYGLFLTDDDGKDQVLSEAQQAVSNRRLLPVEFWSENDWQEAAGIIDPDKKPRKLLYWMTPLQPMPISPRDDRLATEAGQDATSPQGLWLVPMVDSRYFWQFKNVGRFSEENITTIDSLLLSLGSILGDDIQLRCVDGGYTDNNYIPDILDGNDYENAAMLLETVAWHLGCQVVPGIDRTISERAERTEPWYAVLSTEGSEFACEDNLRGYIGLPECTNNTAGFAKPYKGVSHEFVGVPVLVMGGEYDDQGASTPETIIFPSDTDTYTEVSNLDLLDPEGNPLVVSSSVRSGLNAVLRLKYKGFNSIPANIEQQAALDYFWRFRRRYDYTFAGVQKWQPTAYDDFVAFFQDYHNNQFRVQTRVRSWFQNLLPERNETAPQSTGGTTPNPQPSTPCTDCTNCLDPSDDDSHSDCSEAADKSPNSWFIVFEDSFCCIDSQNDINIELVHDSACTWESEERDCTERFIAESWLSDGANPDIDEDIHYKFTLVVGATWATLTLQFYRYNPGVENIASYEWRIRTEEWSSLCDNQLTLNNTDGLVDSPMRQNDIGVCRPPCVICITPFPSISDAPVPCTKKQWFSTFFSSEELVNVVEEDLLIPAQLSAKWVSGNLTSLVNWAGTDIETGDSLANIGDQCDTQQFSLRWNGGGWESDWLPFGTQHTSILERTCKSSGETDTHTTTWDADFRIFIDAVGTFNNCGFTIRSELRAKNSTTASAGFIANFACRTDLSRFCVGSIQSSMDHNQIIAKSSTLSPNPLNWQIAPAKQPDYDPFTLYAGHVGTRYNYAIPTATQKCCVPLASCQDDGDIGLFGPYEKWGWALELTTRQIT